MIVPGHNTSSYYNNGGGGKRSPTSRIMLGLKWLQFFSWPGVCFWSLLWITLYALSDPIRQFLKWPETIAEGINLSMIGLFGIELCSVPIGILLIIRKVPQWATAPNLKRPHSFWLFLVPFFLNISLKVFMLTARHSDVAGSGKYSKVETVIWFGKEIASDIGILMCITLPNFVLGVFVSNFILDDEHNETWRKLSAKQKAEIKLETFILVQQASQFLLFSQFTIHTLLIIFIGCILNVIGSCLNYHFSIILLYALSLSLSALILFHLGVIMEDCYEHLFSIKEKVREDFVKTDELQEAKKLLALMQRIDEQAPFSALGFFTVNRSTLMAEVGTILTYFAVLASYDICPSPSSAATDSEDVSNLTLSSY